MAYASWELAARVAISPEPRESQESKGRGTAAEEDYRSSAIVLFLAVAQNSDKVLLLKGYQHQCCGYSSDTISHGLEET